MCLLSHNPLIEVPKTAESKYHIKLFQRPKAKNVIRGQRHSDIVLEDFIVQGLSKTCICVFNIPW